MRTILYDPPEIEYIDGHPYPKVSPKRTHALVQGALFRAIADCAAGRGQVGTEWRFNLGAVDDTPTEFVPDVAYVSLQRLRALPRKDREEPPFAPDIAAEVRSPSHRRRLLARKIRKYLAAGSVLVLDVDPATRSLRAHSDQGVREYSPGSEFAHAALPWLHFAIDDIFMQLDLPE